MADEVGNTIYYPATIPDQSLPLQADVVSQAATQPAGAGPIAPSSIQNQDLPTKNIAVELVSTKLNTQNQKILKEFQFSPSGAIQIGTYTPGVSGDVRISPNGITARDQSGNTTFALDGDSGDATFAGTIEAGALIAGKVVVGANNLVLDGGNIRILVNDNSFDRVLLGQF